jgi:cell division protein FtsB
MLTLAAVEDVTGTVERNPELIWIGGAVLAVLLIILLIALIARGRRGPATSREDLVERAARAEAQNDALRDDNERLRDENERLRGELDQLRGDGAAPPTRRGATREPT